ncbi:spore germination protein [Paenibacillus sepulcri]|uniref:Spore germination protein n=1 Tax=Paenibacillus sepulcri TaxID=359917 RepID=A0ABS7C1M4_9BACL|nr:spore germination protein [Paenibacillus sepulcri]
MPDKHQITEEAARSFFAHCQDVTVKKAAITDHPAEDGPFIMYCDGLIDAKQINEVVLPLLHTLSENREEKIPVWMNAEILDDTISFTRIAEDIFAGHLVIVFPDSDPFALSVNIAMRPERSTEESNTESSVKGPRDGFTEQLGTNVALIRKRLRSPKLAYKRYVIGTRSKTEVGLLYFQDLVSPEIIEEAQRRLLSIHTEGLIGCNQLEEALSNSPYYLLPLVDYIGRPDFAAESLLNGRFVVLMDGSPMAIIAPINIASLLKSPEDETVSFYFAAFQRIIRYSGLVVSLFLPSLFIALTDYNIEQIPLSFLATIAISRIGIPFSTPFEAFLMVGMFQLFREAGARLPKAVGGTVTVVGGLIVGDAAVRSGLTSPTMIVVIATTTIASYTLVNQTLAGFVAILRILLMILSSLFGMVGFYLGFYLIIIYASWCKSYGMPILSPVSPFKSRDILAGLLKKPWSRKRKPQDVQTYVPEGGGET